MRNALLGALLIAGGIAAMIEAATHPAASIWDGEVAMPTAETRSVGRRWKRC